MSLSITEGRISVSFSRTSRMFEAYSAVRDILTRYIEDPSEWDPTLLDSARGSMIYSWTEKEETVETLLTQAVKAYMRATNSHYNRQFVRALADTSSNRIKQLASELLPAFLDASRTQTVVVCNPSSLGDLVEEFETEFGIQLHTIESLEQFF